MIVLHKIRKAKEYIKPLRHKQDIVSSTGGREENSSMAKYLLYKDGLEITSSTSPYIYDVIKEVTSYFKLDDSVVKAFVISDREIQAGCYLGLEDECIIRISSELVKLMSRDELKFVLAHEMAHFLCEHGFSSQTTSMFQNQYQEVTADRLGLMCCNSLEVAISALIKSVAGLSKEYIQIDIQSYISQMNKYLEHSKGVVNSTHPSMVIRARALIWFSMTETFKTNLTEDFKIKHDSVDEKVENEVEREFKLQQELNKEELKSKVKFWAMAEVIFEKGKLSKEIQQRISLEFKEGEKDKLMSLFTNFSPDEIKAKIKQELNELTIGCGEGELEDARDIAQKLVG